jgi:hypothetical protein
LRKGLFLAGLLVLGIGFYILLMAIGVVPVTGNGSPQWVLGLAGMAFVIGGGLVCIGELIKHDDASTLRDFEVARAFRNVMIAFLLIIFVVLGNWVAFGPGTRPVQAIIGLPFTHVSYQTSEWVGRFGFGISAISLDLMLVFIILATIRKNRNKQTDHK